MKIEELVRWVAEPETHRKILGDYSGTYALGVTNSPPSFHLQVESNEIERFPDRIRIGGETVPVVVEGGLKRPQPLKSMMAE